MNSSRRPDAPPEIGEVASLVAQAAGIIDQALALNLSIDIAAAHAVSHYRSEAQQARQAAGVLIARAEAAEADRVRLVAELKARIAQLEATIAEQTCELEALRSLVWPQTGGAARLTKPGQE